MAPVDQPANGAAPVQASASAGSPATPDSVDEPTTDLALDIPLALATRALFLGLGLVLTAAGIFATVVGVRAEVRGDSALELGLLGSAYFAGFLLGSRLTVVALASVGHIRVYTALAATMAAVATTAGLWEAAPAWIVLRALTGMCLAGLYVVSESWLNDLVPNERRGQVLTSYLMVTTGAFAIGQFLSGRLAASGSQPFAVVTVLTCLAIAPVALSEAARPPFDVPKTRVTLAQLWRIAPTGLITSLMVGAAHGAFLGLVAVYAARVGVDRVHIGLFVAMPTVGNMILAIPFARASDRFDRRAVGVVGALLAAAGGVLLVATDPTTPVGWFAMALIGGSSFPLYSVAGAYTNDHVDREMMSAAASQLVMLFGIGAATGPLVGSALMAAFGGAGFGWATIATHLAVAGFLTIRIVQYPSSVRVRPDRIIRFGLTAIPATAAGAGRRLRLRRRRRDNSELAE